MTLTTDYNAIAEMLRQHVVGATTDGEQAAARAIAADLSAFFATDPRFNRTQFRAACGL